MKKSLFFIITILFFSNFIKGQNPIITKWNTNTNNDNSKQIKIPTIGSFTYTLFYPHFFRPQLVVS